MKKKEPKTIGQRVRFVRGEMTQLEFSAFADVKQPMLSLYEAEMRVPYAEALLNIARASGHSIEWILTGKELDELIATAGKPERAEHVKGLGANLRAAGAHLKLLSVPEADEFTLMMKYLFRNRKRMRAVLDYYKSIRAEKKGKSK